ncbi:MAG: hypothetical protein KAQ85_10175, partial [Thermodesulfovibrionia bacterium]|nr:hypothetical protein [Thermodesulfovibrionia bacterium]
TDLVNFIFPKRYQPTYFRVASDFLRLVLMKDEIDKIDIREFLVDKNYSRSTLENKVIPKLINFGLIKKDDGMITESLTFTAYLEKVAFSWNLLVSNARNMKTYTGAGPNKLHDIRDPEL